MSESAGDYGPHEIAGDPHQGIVIFAESIRWSGVRWGMRSTEAGLRATGYTGQFVYWKWHSILQGCLVLPAIMSSSMLERRAAALAEYITRSRREIPDRPLTLMGFSCGGYVAVRALELLPEDVKVDSAVIFAAAVSPYRDLALACSRVTGKFVVSSSVCDALIVGMGTLMFGTGDRKHIMSIGMIGPRFKPVPENLVDIRWKPGYVRYGNFGGHFTACARRYVKEVIAPFLMDTVS